MFCMSCGRLSYKPFEKYQLPELIPDVDDKGEGRSVRLPHHEAPVVLYRLLWPGQCLSGPASLPWEEVKTWPHAHEGLIFVPSGPNTRGVRLRKMDGKHCLLSTLVRSKVLPDEMPESLAYHFAVNRHAYPEVSIKHVAGLPIARVKQILEARFALDKTYIAAIEYLRQLALAHRDHPLLRDFDTIIRDYLGETCVLAVRNYFMLLGDCIYNEEEKAFARGPDRDWWDRMACYLHWVGRTGRGLYTFHSELAHNDFVKKRMKAEIPDVLEGIEAEWKKELNDSSETGIKAKKKCRGGLGRLSSSS